MAGKNKPNELYITRLYDAPVKLVWEAWTDPQQAAQWWGPRGFTITTHSKDLRAGGHWSYTMHGPDGVDYPNKTIYHEVGDCARLVYDHGGSDDRPPLFRVTVTFEEVRGKTKMDMTMSLASPEAAKEIKQFIKKAGGNATWDRLGEYLGSKSAGKNLFLINRTFEASPETLFDMWVNPEHLAAWLPPPGFQMKVLSGRIAAGELATYSMSNGQLTMHGQSRYLEVRRPSGLIYTQRFVDAEGKPGRHPLLPVWPETLLVTVTITDEEEGRSRVTVQSEPMGQCSQSELDDFLQHRGSMTMGWTASFDQLEELLQR